MVDVQSLDAISSRLGTIETQLNSIVPKYQSLINPSATGSSNALSSSLGAFSNIGGGPVSNIIGGVVEAAAGVAVGASMAMPDVASVINMQQGYYQTGLKTPGVSRTTIGNAMFSAMAGGITSPGSPAQVASAMSQMGINFSTDKNSTWMQMTRNVANSAKYLGQDNMTAMQAITGLTSGSMSGNLASTMGIYTSDMSGNTRSESQIFQDIWAQLTAGQPKANVQDVMDSFYKGNLGADLTNLGFSDAQKQRFLQFAIQKAGGNTMDLSSNKTTSKLMSEQGKQGNTNPILSTLKINTTQTDQMQAASGVYEKGQSDTAKLVADLNQPVKDLISNFGELNANLQTFLGTNVGKGAATAATSVVSGAAKTVSGIIDAVTQALEKALPMLIPMGGSSKGNSLGMLTPGGVGGVSNGISSGYTGDAWHVNAPGSGLSSTHIPANGRITATLHEKGPMWGPNGHNGTDFGVGDRSPVYAAADGKVVTDAVSHAADGGYGHYVMLDHGGGYKTLYAHLDPSSADVHPGDVVKAGQVIGKSGHTGHVTGPHLHFEVQKDGQSVPIEGFLGGAVGIKSQKKKKGKGTTSSDPWVNLQYGLAGFFGSLDSSVNSMLGISNPASSATVSVPSWTGSKFSGVSSGAATGVGGTYGGNSLGGVTSGTTTVSSSGPAKVEINLSIAQASADEAKKFAALVKSILEGDQITANMGAF
jgi:murein DD-endopeptidase MepM/ murein hydrolase activator NlpD